MDAWIRECRLLDTEVSTAAENMATDEAILAALVERVVRACAAKYVPAREESSE